MRFYGLALLAGGALAISGTALAQSSGSPETAVPASAAPVPTSAQAPPPVTVPAAEPCSVRLLDQGKDKPGDLVAICSGKGVNFGSAAGFSSSYNPTIGRYLIVSRSERGANVFLLRPPTETMPALIERMNNVLAASARGMKWLQVRELAGDVDIAGFATTGEVRLTGAALNKPVDAKAQPVAVKLANDAGVMRATSGQPVTAPAGGK